jgi:nucleotide-binding universal stress UspA family protein
MAIAKFPIVVGTDGSSTAGAALATMRMFPWPEGAKVHAVVARRTRATAGRPRYVVMAFDRAFAKAASDARALLSRRWPDVGVTVLDKRPVEALLAEARRVGAKAIVVGWRGHGPIGRLLLGSVSRGIVRHATCPVLVVRQRSKQVRRLLIGIDGSDNARRAVDLVTAFPPPAGASVTLVTALEPISLPSRALLPAQVRHRVGQELMALKAEMASNARRELDNASARLRDAGWRVRTILSSGTPLAVLLTAVRQTQADVLVIGARGSTGLQRFVLGSVAEGALNRCAIPVFLVR